MLALEVGAMKPGQKVEVVGEVETPEGTWVRLSAASQQSLCAKHMLHLEAWSLSKRAGQVYLCDDSQQRQAAPPHTCDLLQGVSVLELKKRLYLLEYLSNTILPLLSLMELPTDPAFDVAGTGLVSSPDALLCLQRTLLSTHKERTLKSIIARKTEVPARPTITLNRAGLKADRHGGATVCEPVFAQACAALLTLPASTFSPPAACGRWV